MPRPDANAEAISRLLAEHVYNLGVCYCGVGEGRTFGIDATAHRAHVASIIAAHVAQSRPAGELADFDPSTSHRHGCKAYADWTNAECGCIDDLFAIAQDAEIALSRSRPAVGDPGCVPWQYGACTCEHECPDDRPHTGDGKADAWDEGR